MQGDTYSECSLPGEPLHQVSNRDIKYLPTVLMKMGVAIEGICLQKIIHLSLPNQEDDPSKLFN